ncbi:cytochrome P450 2G1-like [Gastrophryne carolinensis]
MHFPEDVTLLLSLVVCGLLCFLSLRQLRRRGKLPPGPTPLPVLGNILQLRGALLTSLLKIKETYGDVFTIYLGSRPVVVFCGYKMVKEVYVDRGDDFLARGDIAVVDSTYKNYGIAFTSDMTRWRELRRFSMSAMRDFGLGKTSIEVRIQEEAWCLIQELKKTNALLFDPHPFLNKASGNIIFSIMFGKRHDYDDAELLGVLDYISETMYIMSSRWGEVFQMFPRIMPLIPGKHQTLLSNMQKLLTFVKKRVDNNWKTLDPDNPRDYVDAFLIKIEKEKANPNSEYHLTNLVYSTLQIFFAGMETTSSTLVYALLILMKYPDVLDKVYEEIDQVIGRDRIPKLQDRNQMPFTEAVIHELQRFITLVPMGLARKTTRDVKLRGYIIPKGTNICPVIATVLKDPTCFPYPNEFNPKNFIDENGKFTKNDAFMPLSAGKRNCLGEALVRMEIFLFLVTILQNFTLQPEHPKERLDISPAVSGLEFQTDYLCRSPVSRLFLSEPFIRQISPELSLDPHPFLNKASGNIIFSIMFGKRHDYEDVELLDVLQNISEATYIFSSHWGEVFEMFPRIMPFIPGKHQKLLSIMQQLLSYVKKRVENNWKTLDSDNPRDYVDAFLIKIKKFNKHQNTKTGYRSHYGAAGTNFSYKDSINNLDTTTIHPTYIPSGLRHLN